MSLSQADGPLSVCLESSRQFQAGRAIAGVSAAIVLKRAGAAVGGVADVRSDGAPTLRVRFISYILDSALARSCSASVPSFG